ncbi:MAG: hypothetical protein LBF41_07045 [Deltaproteobacteria bacterium]|jgi:hypothetical protein|nr:hypothetical protein [Deltaproteobacteria bacterium]
MLNIILTQTTELDEPELALEQLLKRSDVEKNLKKNSVGIIHCHDLFIKSGFAKLVAEALPFPAVGMNTFLHATSLSPDENILFSLMILTSDEEKFRVGVSDPLEANISVPMEKLYRDLRREVKGRAAFGLLFTPPLITGEPIGELLVDILNADEERIPCFGGMAAGYTDFFKDPAVIHDGETHLDRMALLLVEGDTVPRFKIFQSEDFGEIYKKGIITRSRGHVIQEIDNRPPLEFFESSGLCANGAISGIHAIPLYLDRKDGSPPVIRGIDSQLKDGTITLPGRVPEGTTMGLGLLAPASVIENGKALGTWIRDERAACSLVYSCISRNFALGLDYTKEIEAVKANVAKDSKYVFSYSASEFCPVLHEDGKWHNEYHNMTMIATSF